jgi:DNA polymerase-1
MVVAMVITPAAALDELRRSTLVRGGMLALHLAAGVGGGIAGDGGLLFEVDDAHVASLISAIECEFEPRWVLWSNAPAALLRRTGLRLGRSWDLAAVHRLVMGGWKADPARVWATAHGLDEHDIPTLETVDLFTVDRHEHDDLERAIDSSGHLRPEWTASSWTWSTSRLAEWAHVALTAARLQEALLAGEGAAPRLLATARCESTAELLCADLAVAGLPFDRVIAEQIIGDLAGPRPANETEAATQRRERDALVVQHSPTFPDADLRNPTHVKSLLRSVGVEVPDTRAWRLESLREQHPLIEALLVWRKAERVATTFGYGWLDDHLGADGRLRGDWSGCDGAAGRMTATAGLHNMPALMRDAVVAEPGYVFVRADLGQIEPRVLAAVSGDAALARATVDDDMYAPVAAALGVDRPTAKVAVLGAMYGQTTGHGAQALRRLESAYPVAMRYLSDADLAGQHGRNLRTYGGRLIRTGSLTTAQLAEREARSNAAAQGRYARNAMVQGAAAELFKMWAVIVRARISGAEIVLCLHDELLVHVPASDAALVEQLVHDCLQEAAYRWAPDDSVRFVAEVSVIHRWSDAGH